MKNHETFFLTLILSSIVILILSDYYAWKSVNRALKNSKKSVITSARVIFILTSIYCYSMLLLAAFGDKNAMDIPTRNFIMLGVFVIFFGKLIVALVLLLEDITRGIRYIIKKLNTNSKKQQITSKPADNQISRSEFINKLALGLGGSNVALFSFGVLSGAAYDYQIKKQKLVLPNLPKAFEGMRIGQLSDIHSGSFYNKNAVRGGVEMLLAEKTDMIFFTGDLVNERSSEFDDYFDVFKKVQAPLGVYSVLGNHDYGDYVQWESEEAKRNDVLRLMKAHAEMGWHLMMDENKILTESGENIAIVGVQNYGKGRFPKYGNLQKAIASTDEASVKLLLSHDPSHWDMQVQPEFKDVDVMFSGHTHGFQFGVEYKNIKWSPLQGMYEQWAGLYKKNGQLLYVNRGYGFIGYPGRIGILPEITIFELSRA